MDLYRCYWYWVCDKNFKEICAATNEQRDMALIQPLSREKFKEILRRISSQKRKNFVRKLRRAATERVYEDTVDDTV